MKRLVYFIFLSLAFCLIACQRHPHIQPLLQEAEVLMESRPDSSLFLLESIQSPEKLSSEEYATWCLLITQARDKNYVEHTSDSVINVAVRYFEKRKDPLRKAQAYYCQGRVLSELNVSGEALAAYLKAKENVGQTSDCNLMARICNHLGTLYWRNGDDLKSLVYYKDTYWAYKLCKDTIGIVSALRNIGDGMLALKQQDSAYFYLEEALRFTDLGHIESQKTYILSSLDSLYCEKGNYRKALELNKKSLDCSNEESTLFAGNYAIGELYEKLNKPDSALFYLEKVLMGTDLYVKCSANHLLYNLAIKNREYEKAFKYNERYLLLRDSIEHMYRPQELLKIESLYNKERLLNKQKQQMHEAHSRQYVLIIAFLCVFLICVIIYIVYEKKIREQIQKSQEMQRKLQETRNLLTIKEADIKEKEGSLAFVQLKFKENEEKISFYIEKINYLEEGCVSLQDEYEQKLREAQDERAVLNKEKENILNETTSLINQKNQLLEQKCRMYDYWSRRLILQNNYLSTLVKSKNVVLFESKDWNLFLENFESVYPGFIDYLNDRYSMGEREFRICCLVKLGLKTGKIAVIFNLGSDTITKLKSEIKEKYFALSEKQTLDRIIEKMPW